MFSCIPFSIDKVAAWFNLSCGIGDPLPTYKSSIKEILILTVKVELIILLGSWL